MSVDRLEVRRIASLAHLALDDAELDRLTDELNRILGYVDALGTLELAAESDLGEHHRDVRSTRDAATESADALERSPETIAPDWRQGFFVVPPPPGVQADEGDA